MKDIHQTHGKMATILPQYYGWPFLPEHFLMFTNIDKSIFDLLRFYSFKFEG